MASFSVSYIQNRGAGDQSFKSYGEADCDLFEGSVNPLSWHTFTMSYSNIFEGTKTDYEVEGDKIFNLGGVINYLRNSDVMAIMGTTTALVDEIETILTNNPIYTVNYPIGGLPYMPTSGYTLFSAPFNVAVSGVGCPKNSPFGTPLSNDYNSAGSISALYVDQTQYNFQGYFEFLSLFNMLKIGNDAGLFDLSTSLKEIVDKNNVAIRTDKSTHFDVYIKSFKNNVVIGGYETTSVTVRWENGRVMQSLEEDEDYPYRNNNTTINISVNNALGLGGAKPLDTVLYGQGQYEVTAQKLFGAIGNNKVIDIISAIIPSSVIGDAYLVLSLTYETETLPVSDSVVAEIPLNSTTQDASRLHTIQGAFGSTVAIHYVDSDEEIPPIDPTKNPVWDLGLTPYDDTYQTDPSDDTDIVTSQGFNSNINLLTKSYAVSESSLQTLGDMLWSDGFLENIALVNNSPIENIISVKAFPFAITGGTSKTIKLGNVTMTGATGNELSHSYTPIKVIGQPFTIPKKFGGTQHAFLDFAPYTTVTLYLPYCGFHEIDLSQYMDIPIQLKYIYDVITGVCTACLYYKSGNRWIEFEKFSGNIAIDIPISASNRAQVQASYLQGGLNALANIATAQGLLGKVMGAVNAGLDMLQTPYHTTTTGSPSPSCDGFDEQNAYIIVNRPVYKEPSAFGHEYGYPCNLTKQLKNLSGYTKCHEVDVSSIICTESERQQIKEMLESGVYL